jgi:hypothetical protein
VRPLGVIVVHLSSYDSERVVTILEPVKPDALRDEYEGKVKDLQAKVGELVLERDALKKLSALLDSTEKR